MTEGSIAVNSGPDETRVPGRIITFYSYKGGVGRSFALANVAAILSRWGARVLCVDWDLEAPGLHHFFPRSQSSERSAGLLQLLESAARRDTSAAAPRSSTLESATLDWKACVETAAIGQTEKTIDLIASGRDAEDYVRRVHDLDWQALYERHALGDFLERLRQEWTRDYDFVLLDSRTGLTDIGGICTIHLPDVVVSVFTANHQSMEGTAYMAARINEQRRDFFYSSGKALIMPLLSRWEERDAPDDAKQWLPKVLDTLRPSYDQWRGKDAPVERLVELLKIPYKAKWNFGERLAVLEESATDPGSVSYHLHIIAATLARDFSDTDLLACEPERYVRLASQEAPRKRIRIQPPRGAGLIGRLRRGSSCAPSKDGADGADGADSAANESANGGGGDGSNASDMELAMHIRAFLHAAFAVEIPGRDHMSGCEVETVPTSAGMIPVDKLIVDKIFRLLNEFNSELTVSDVIGRLATLHRLLGPASFRFVSSSDAKQFLVSLLATSLIRGFNSLFSSSLNKSSGEPLPPGAKSAEP